VGGKKNNNWCIQCCLLSSCWPFSGIVAHPPHAINHTDILADVKVYKKSELMLMRRATASV